MRLFHPVNSLGVGSYLLITTILKTTFLKIAEKNSTTTKAGEKKDKFGILRMLEFF
jgi:hypothetical protein